MSAQVCIPGFGRMAVSIGAYFAGRGAAVHWISRRAATDPAVSAELAKIIRRLRRTADAGAPMPGLHDSSGIGGADAVIECREENLAVKRETADAACALMRPDALYFTNSSSLPPSQIHGRCLGLHFFYPVELNGLVELIVPDDCPEKRRAAADAFVAHHGLTAIVQTERTAFAVNRMLLPLQVEAIRLIGLGADPSAVDEGSRSELLGTGVLSLMDAVGLPTICAAVRAYISRMPADCAGDYGALLETLDAATGRDGRRSGAGFVSGPKPFPWRIQRRDPAAIPVDLRAHFRNLLAVTCLRFLARKEIDAVSLRLACGSVWHGTVDPDFVVAREGEERVRSWCRLQTETTGISYFRPW